MLDILQIYPVIQFQEKNLRSKLKKMAKNVISGLT